MKLHVKSPIPFLSNVIYPASVRLSLCGWVHVRAKGNCVLTGSCDYDAGALVNEEAETRNSPRQRKSWLVAHLSGPPATAAGFSGRPLRSIHAFPAPVKVESMVQFSCPEKGSLRDSHAILHKET